MFLLLQVLSIKGLGSLSFAKSIPCNEMFGSTLYANQSFKMCQIFFLHKIKLQLMNLWMKSNRIMTINHSMLMFSLILFTL